MFFFILGEACTRTSDYDSHYHDRTSRCHSHIVRALCQTCLRTRDRDSHYHDRTSGCHSHIVRALCQTCTRTRDRDSHYHEEMTLPGILHIHHKHITYTIQACTYTLQAFTYTLQAYYIYTSRRCAPRDICDVFNSVSTSLRGGETRNIYKQS